MVKNSEESRIVKAWHDLLEKAKIIDRKQLIQDFDDLLTEQWPCIVVGMYVSKYLQEPRHALKVYELLSGSVKQVSEKVQKSIKNLGSTKIIFDHSVGFGKKIVLVKEIFKNQLCDIEVFK